MKNWKKKISVLILFISIFLVTFGMFYNRLEAAEDGDLCWTNFSNIAVSSKTGCNAQNVYQNCTFYSNFWNPNGNIKIRSVTVKLMKGSTTVFNQTKYSSDSNHYFNYVSIPITISEAGTYTVERSYTTLSGGTGIYENSTLIVRDVSLCGTILSATQTSVSLDMTGVYSKEITMSIAGVRPKTSTISYSCSNTNVSCSWGGWYDADGDGSNESNDLMITGKVGGTTTITISFKDTNTGTVITTKNINVTIGPSYTISYNANGGSGAPSSQTKTYGNTLTLSSTKPTRSGYEFVGWSTSSSATSATYSSGATYTSNASTTLYAVWVKLANTMSLGTRYSTSITSAGEWKYYKFVPISSGEYSFATVGEEDTYGYLYDSKMNQLTYNDDGGEDYNCKIKYSLTAGNTYYYAVKMYSSSVIGSFTTSIGKSTYEICYDENAVTTIVEVEYGSYHKIQSEIIGQTGYTFLGWSTSNSDISPEYIEGDLVINLDATGGRVYLYPVWSINTYTIQYDANGGSGAPSSQTKTYGQTLTLSSTKPTRSGYTFLGWSTSNSATSATYSSGGSYTTNSNVTLYAVWEINRYTITYNANGGSGAPASQTVTHGESFAISSVKPTKTDCVFLGWSTSSTATSATYEQGDYYATDSNVTFYAVWAKEITKGDTIVNISNAGDVITYNFTPSITGTYTIESIGGYDTYGRLYDCEFNELTYDDDSGDSTNFSMRYRLEAGTTYLISTRMYSASNTGSFTINISLKYCEITYNANGGSNSPNTQTVISGEYAYLSNSIPSKSYMLYFYDDDNDYISDKDIECEFVEWYSSTGGHYQSGDIINIDENVILYAQWDEPQIGTLPTPTKDGYVFNGWYLADGTRVYSTTKIDGDTEVYAKWIQNEYSINYYANGGSNAPSSQIIYGGESVTLTTSIPSKKYRVTYNVNGGESLSTSYKDIECEFDSWYDEESGNYYYPGEIVSGNRNFELYAQWEYPQAGTLPTPTRSKYNFVGWYTSATGGTRVYSTTSITQNTTIYAHWERSYYTVEYNANGGSGAPSSQVKYVGTALMLSKSVPTRAGYEFLGWSTSSTATSATYNAGASFTIESDTVLYAVWKMIPETTTAIETTTCPPIIEETTTLSKIIIPMPDGLFFMNNALYWVGNDLTDSYNIYVDGVLVGVTTYEYYYFSEGFLPAGYHYIGVASVRNGKESEISWIDMYLEYPKETTTEQEWTTAKPSVETTIYIEPTTTEPPVETTIYIEPTTTEPPVETTIYIEPTTTEPLVELTTVELTTSKRVTESKTVQASTTKKYTNLSIEKNLKKNQATKKHTQSINVKLTKPKINKIKNKRLKKIWVKWKKIKNVDGYIVQYYQAKKKKLKRTRRLSKNAKSVILTGFKRGEKYCVRIRGYKRVNGETYYSKWSSVKKIKVKN